MSRVRCPYCGGLDVRESVEWFCHSLEPCDLENTAILTEFACANEGEPCEALSFWCAPNPTSSTYSHA